MNNERNKIIAKRLFVLWIALFSIFGIISNVYVIDQTVTTGISPIHMLSSHQLITLLMVVVLFNPLLYLVHYFAKKSGVKALITISKVLFVFCSIWSLIMLVLTINALVLT